MKITFHFIVGITGKKQMASRFVFKCDRKYRWGMIRTICVIFFIWAFALVYALLFEWKNFRSLGILWQLKLVLVCYTIITIIILIYEIREILLNQRTVTISKNGIIIEALKRKEYSWPEIQSVSIDNPSNAKVNESYSLKYRGKVVIISPSRNKRIKYWHPFAMNKLLFTEMICIYLEKKEEEVERTDDDLFIHFNEFNLYEGKEEEIRTQFKDWGVELAYDYQENYYQKWNNRQLKRYYERITISEINSNGKKMFVSTGENNQIVGIWFNDDGYDCASVLESIKNRTMRIDNIVLNGRNDCSLYGLGGSLFPDTKIVYESFDIELTKDIISPRKLKIDGDLKLKLVYEILRRDKSVDKDLLWKIGQQAYHW